MLLGLVIARSHDSGKEGMACCVDDAASKWRRGQGDKMDAWNKET
jgi:hypothetical protein